MDGDSIFGWFMGIILVLLLVLMIGFISCVEGEKGVKNQAVEFGYGEWYGFKNESFRWLPTRKVQPETPAPLLPPCCNCGKQK